jgi:hypothetical protein
MGMTLILLAGAALAVVAVIVVVVVALYAGQKQTRNTHEADQPD